MVIDMIFGMGMFVCIPFMSVPVHVLICYVIVVLVAIIVVVMMMAMLFIFVDGDETNSIIHLWGCDKSR